MVEIVADFKFAWEELNKRRTRSFLTVLAIVIGIGAVVALMSIGQGLQNSINKQFQLMGVDKLIISPGGPLFGIGGSTAQLVQKDVDTIASTMGVKSVTGMVYKLAKVEYGNDVM